MINNNLKKRVYTSILLLLLLYLISTFEYVLTYTLIVFGTLSILEFLTLTKKIFKSFYYRYLVNILSISYISLFCFFFFLTSNFFQLKVILFIFLLGCIASDIGGFIIGKIFKGPKLTKISPNKTYSGAAGSILFTSVFIYSSFIIFTNKVNFTILILSIIISISCQIGDLFFSFLKRKARVKDTGNVLPGHGGILDRVDGILLGVPFGFLTLILIK